MTEPPLPPGARRYLEQLELASAELPTAHRTQLLEQIHEHLAEAIDDGAELSSVLLRLGTPEEVVADARPSDARRGPSWERVMLRFAIASAIACGAGLLGVIVAAAMQLRGMLLLPSLLVLLGGAATLLATAVLAGALRRTGERDRQARDALLARPSVAATLIAGSTALALGLLGAFTGALMMAMTANPRSGLIGALGIALALAGGAVVWRTARSLRSPSTGPGENARP